LETGGVRLFPFLARLRIIFGSAGVGNRAGMLPDREQRSLPSLLPVRIRATMIVMGVALGGGLAGHGKP
jgi:hypothetical protein